VPKVSRTIERPQLESGPLGLLPSRIGYSKLVDDAALAFVNVVQYMFMRQHNQAADQLDCVKSYGKALSSLKHSISHPRRDVNW